MSNVSVTELFDEAIDDGNISHGSLMVLQNIGAHFQAALGAPASQVTASEITLFYQDVDNTASLSRFVAEVREGHNLAIDSLKESKQASGILAATAFHDRVLSPFTLLENAVLLDANNYQATLGHTRLYDSALDALAAVTIKAQEFASNGVPCRTVTLIISDGVDNASNHRATDVAQVVGDLLRQESHIIAGMGIDDGYTDFEQVFGDMGLQKNWILTPKKDKHALRQAFQVVSQSAVRASQGAASFSSTALGGFGV